MSVSPYKDNILLIHLASEIDSRQSIGYYFLHEKFCQMMHLLVSANIQLLKSLQMLEEIILFYPFNTSLGDIAKGIIGGSAFVANLGKYEKLYRKKLVALIKVGEETNTLDKMLH